MAPFERQVQVWVGLSAAEIKGQAPVYRLTLDLSPGFKLAHWFFRSS